MINLRSRWWIFYMNWIWKALDVLHAVVLSWSRESFTSQLPHQVEKPILLAADRSTVEVIKYKRIRKIPRDLLVQCFTDRGDFVSQRILGNVWRYFWMSNCKKGIAPGIQCQEARDATGHPAVHRTAICSKDYSKARTSTSQSGTWETEA